MQSSFCLKTAQIDNTPYSFSFSFSFEKNFYEYDGSDHLAKEEIAFNGSPELEQVKMVCNGVITKKETDFFLLKGSYEASFEGCCHLCSENFPFFKKGSLSLFLSPQQDVARKFNSSSSHSVDDEVDVAHYQGGELNLNSYFKEQFLLDLPFCMKCKDDCKGFVAL